MASVSNSELDLFKSFLTVVDDDTKFDTSAVPSVAPLEVDSTYNAMLYAGIPDANSSISPEVYSAPAMQSVSFVVRDTPHESIKSIKIYKIEIGGKTLISRIYSKDACAFICNGLTKGKAFDEPEILGALSLGLQYTKSIDALVQIMKKRQDALRSMDYDSAKTFDAEIQMKQKLAADTLKLISEKFSSSIN